MADVNGLLNDQDFQKLDPASQRQALSRVTGDQSFNQLSDDDTKQFISRVSTPKSTPIQDDTSVRAAAPAPSLFNRAIGAMTSAAQIPLNPLGALHDWAYSPTPNGPEQSDKPTFLGTLNSRAKQLTRIVEPEVSLLSGGISGAGTAEVAPEAREVLGGIGDALRNPATGKLKPLVDVAARGAGAYVGHGVGRTIDPQSPYGGYAGEVAGAIAGPTVADALVPASGTFQGTQTATQLEQGINEVQTARQKELADTERLRNMEAQSIQNRGKQQEVLDRSIQPVSNAYEPTQQEQDLGAFMNRGYKPIPSTPPPTIVPNMETVADPVFSGSEGRAATWDEEALMREAAKGNRDAISQKILRGYKLSPGERYIMGDPDYSRAIHNPLETTTFEPENTNIRNLSKSPASSRARIAVPNPYSPTR